jgi:hypothetical protein
MTKSQASDVNKQEGDGSVSDKSAKLKNILDKIRQKNTDASDTKGGLSLKSSGYHSDNTVAKFSPIKFGDSIVGEEIIKTRFKNGHCKGMLNGVIEEKIVS